MDPFNIDKRAKLTDTREVIADLSYTMAHSRRIIAESRALLERSISQRRPVGVIDEAPHAASNSSSNSH
jgi:hypothetical protein